MLGFLPLELALALFEFALEAAEPIVVRGGLFGCAALTLLPSSIGSGYQ